MTAEEVAERLGGVSVKGCGGDAGLEDPLGQARARASLGEPTW
jgi:hypothetical protein